MFSFERMIAWQKSIEFVDEVFDISDRLPQKYQFSLGEQLRRATLSITNNLAEGSGRGTSALQRNFYDIAKGSMFEVMSILAVIHKRKLINDVDLDLLRTRAKEIVSIIFGLIKATYENEGKVVRDESGIYETDPIPQT